MNAKAEITTKELLELVLAIVSILIVVGVAVLLYSNYVNDKVLEEAKASLNFLVSQISNGAEEVVIYNPDNWGEIIKNRVGIVSFSSLRGQELPKFCLDKEWSSCICICAKAPNFQFRMSCLTPDNNKITCLESDFSIEEEIKNPPITLLIDQENKIIRTK